ncbi:hypothetical protein PHYBOEH_001450 [Phytophthora boehmeriae]|uniref:Elicitor-like transglutaminase n=1 Tax=Phytophthora boehmeriae TaxID=109152 RepID=A0A8T1WZP9_9STRA|nr:hypothetical protein PHYBOEH_001450 [Phytophthora boehmeriae]
MASRLPTPPRLRYALLLLSVLQSTARGEAITDNLITPLGETALLTHNHPAFGGSIRKSDIVKPVTLTEQNRDSVRGLEAALSDLERLEAYFGEPMECDYNVLKDSYSKASTEVPPWSGNFWPTYKDGINFKWKTGEPSAAEKYATAFDLDVDSFTNGISLSTGILSEAYDGSTACTSDDDCSSGSLCGIRDGASSGFCIPTWFGICHAWAAAAIYEKEPMCDAHKNNVTFHPVDIKALLSQAYDGAAIEVVFTGARFNGPDSPEELDQYGRYVDSARRDISSGFFHIAVANILGKHKQSFIVDVSSDSPVWNQPVQKYEFLETEIVDAAKLSQEYFGNATYPFNDNMKYMAKCTTRLTWTAESLEDGALTATGRIAAYTAYQDYEYCLELDENYAVIGGEWLGDSRKDHPDFLWLPAAKPSTDTVTDTGMYYQDVIELLEQSQQCDPTDLTISPDVDDPQGTKTPGTTKSPGYTKTPATKTPPSTTPPTQPPATKTPEPPTYSPETPAPYTHNPTYSPETPAPYTHKPTYSPETPAPYTHKPTYSPETPAPYTHNPTYSPETPAPYTHNPTYSPETPAPYTHNPTYSPETPAPYTPRPSLICSEETPSPTTEEPSYPPSETPVVTTAAPTEAPTSTPKATSPSQSQNQNQNSKSKWTLFRRLFQW